MDSCLTIYLKNKDDVCMTNSFILSMLSLKLSLSLTMVSSKAIEGSKKTNDKDRERIYFFDLSWC